MRGLSAPGRAQPRRPAAKATAAQRQRAPANRHLARNGGAGLAFLGFGSALFTVSTSSSVILRQSRQSTRYCTVITAQCRAPSRRTVTSGTPFGSGTQEPRTRTHYAPPSCCLSWSYLKVAIKARCVQGREMRLPMLRPMPQRRPLGRSCPLPNLPADASIWGHSHLHAS